MNKFCPYIYISLLMLIPSAANSLQLKLSDALSYSGSLEHQFSYAKVGSRNSVASNISTMRLNLSTYLWRPWIATLDGGLAFSYISRKNSHDSTGQDVSGNANFNLFPQSRFPFRAYFSKMNNRIEGDITDQDLTVTTYGVNQTYIKGPTYLNLNYYHTVEDDEDNLSSSGKRSREDVEDSLELSMSTSVGSHVISADSRFNFIDRTTPSISEDQTTHVVRHNYRSDTGTDLSVNNLFTYTDRTTESILGPKVGTSLMQLNSNVFWRPKTEKRLLVTGSALMQGSDDLFDATGVTGLVNYQWNPYLNFRTRANFAKSRTNTQSLQEIGVEYSPADTPLFGFMHTYNVSADVSNRTDDLEDGRQELNVRGGHIFSRDFPTAIGRVNVSATQRVATILDTRGKSDRTISHTLGAGWNKTTGNSTNFLRATLSDTRRFSNDIDELGFQQANLQLTRTQQLSRESSWNGNITFQANKTLNDNFGSDTVNLNGSILLSYNHRRVFGVPRLRLQSELRYMSRAIFEVSNSDGLDDDYNNNDVFWQNRLNYGIGRLNFRLTTNIGMNDGEFNNFVLFQVRRNFGR